LKLEGIRVCRECAEVGCCPGIKDILEAIEDLAEAIEVFYTVFRGLMFVIVNL